MHKNHCKRVADWLGACNISLYWQDREKRVRKSAKFPKPHSTLPIPTVLTESVQSILLGGELPSECAPESSVLDGGCKCGAGWADENELLCTGNIFTSRCVVERKVYVRWCRKRVCRAHYDGSSAGIFNYSSKTMVTYDVLRDYANCALGSGMTFAGFTGKKTREYSSVYGGERAFLYRGSFTKLYISYVERKEKASKDPCDICKQYPPVLLADATDLGMPMKHLEATYREILPSTAARSENEPVPFKKRILIVAASLRQMLLHFVRGSDTGKMNRSKWKKMLKGLRKENSSVVAVLEHLYSIQPDKERLGHFHFAGEWSDILKVVGSFNSITDLIRPGAYEVVGKLATEEDVRLTPVEQAQLERFAPLISKLLVAKGGAWPTYGRCLLSDILKVCKRPFIDSVAPILDLTPVSQGNPMSTGHWYTIQMLLIE